MIPIELNYGEHIIVLGKTGEGKTVLLQYLLTCYDRAIVYDIEQMDGYEYIDKAVIVNSVEQATELLNQPSFRVIFRPRVSDVVSGYVRKIWDDICRLAFSVGSVAVFCDEIAFTQQGKMNIEPHANAIIMLGRKRYVSFVVASRRNQEIHNNYITQSTHYFIFRLQPYEINIYREYIPNINLCYGLEKYHCLYINSSGDYKILTPFPLVTNVNKTQTPQQGTPPPIEPNAPPMEGNYES